MIMTIIWAVLIFSVLIFVHELGHFTFAKIFDIKIHEFAIGMGPAIWKKRRGETLYAVRALPIGGYVKMEGEDGDSEDERSFGKRPAPARLAILLAGAFMNIITGFIIFLIIMGSVKEIPIPVVASIVPDSPAAEAGLMPGDRIIRINGDRINIQDDVTFALYRSRGREIDIAVKRDGAREEMSLTPMLDEGSGEYKIGFITQRESVNVFGAVKHAYFSTFYVIKLVYVSLWDMISGKASLKQVSGPVGIVNEIGQAAKAGVLNVLFLAALIAINLGVMNLLPLPALDGGRIMFVLFEMVRKRPVKPKYEAVVHLTGLFLLLLFMLIVTWSDISRLAGPFIKRIMGGA